MNWERMILGRRGEALGRWRWPLGAVGGTVLAVLFALSGTIAYAVIAAAAAALCVYLTIRSFR